MFKLTLRRTAGKLAGFRRLQCQHDHAEFGDESANGNILTSISRSQPELQAARFSPKASLASNLRANGC